MTTIRTPCQRVMSGLLGLALVALSVSARADEAPGPWQTDLESAKRMAHASRRLVLVHFWAPWCAACTRMENDVYAQPGYHEALAGMYVPVKLNADSNHELVQQLGVTALPTDVVITPSGQVVDRLQGAQDAQTHLARMTQIARKVNPSAQPGIVGPAGAVPQAPIVNAAPTAPTQPGASVVAPWDSAPAPTQSAAMQPQGTFQPVATHGAVQTPAPTPAAAAGSPAPGLDGYCPVNLCERHLWTKGSRDFGAVHRGRVYLFSSAEACNRFLANPDRYAPVAGGDDPVVAMQQGQAVAGRREFGMFYQGRVFLFASPQTRDAFKADPNRYAAEVMQARR
ncbi:MAG: thioredoxin family protein [Pirellulales bacterium]|nr:thioredoxin family protein [Pirellulales bacterium]